MDPEQDTNQPEQNSQSNQQPKGELSKRVKGLSEGQENKPKLGGGSVGQKVQDVKKVAKASQATAAKDTAKEIKEGYQKGGAVGAAGATAREAAGQATAAGLEAVTAGAATPVAQKVGKAVSVALKKENLPYLLAPLFLLGFLGLFLFYAAANPTEFAQKVLESGSFKNYGLTAGRRLVDAVQSSKIARDEIYGKKIQLAKYEQNSNSQISLISYDPNSVSWATPPKDCSLGLVVRYDGLPKFLCPPGDTVDFNKKEHTFIYNETEEASDKNIQIIVDICMPIKGMLINRSTGSREVKIDGGPTFAYMLEQWMKTNNKTPPLDTCSGSQSNGSSGSSSSQAQDTDAQYAQDIAYVPLKERLAKINANKIQYQTTGHDSVYKIKASPSGSFEAFTDRQGNVVQIDKENENMIADSMTQIIPIMGMTVRGPRARVANNSSKVKFNYAAKEDSKVFSGKSQEEADKLEVDKTLARVRGGNEQQPNFYEEENVFDSEEIKKINGSIEKARKELLEGKDPDTIQIEYPFGPTTADNRIKEICAFYQVFLSESQIKKSVEARADSNRKNAAKILTYADTEKAIKVNPKEKRAIIEQLSDWSQSAGYQLTVSDELKGINIQPEALHQRALSVYQEKLKPVKENCIKVVTGNLPPKDSEDGSKARLAIVQSFIDVYMKPLEDSPYIKANNIKVNFQYILDRSMAVAAGITATGTEDGPQNFNRMMQGSKQLSSDYMQTLGGRFLSEEEQQNINLALESVKREKEISGGIAYRVFNTDNIRSLASKIAALNPMTPKTAYKMASSFLADIINPIKILANVTGSFRYYAFGQHDKALADSVDQSNYFKLQPIGYSLQEVNDINMIDNASYIESQMSKHDKNINIKYNKWKTCLDKKITSPIYFSDLASKEEKDELVSLGCDKLLEKTSEDPEAIKFLMYQTDSSLVDSLVSLSNDEEDPNLSDAAGKTPDGGATGEFAWPVPGPVTSCFGPRLHPIQKIMKQHTGLDISARRPQKVSSADGGKVIFAGSRGGYGQTIEIEHGGGKVTRYAHLLGGSFLVNQGDSVGKGQELATVDSTGSSTGDHLHFEILLNGKQDNPLKYLINDGRGLGGCSADYEGKR